METEDFVKEELATGQRRQHKAIPATASHYLRCARIDLRASRSLSKAGIYAPAVFYLQQSVEKATKSLILWLGVLCPGRLQKLVEHDTPMAFLELVKVAEIAPFVDTISGFFYMDFEGDAMEMEETARERAPQMARLRYETIVAGITLSEEVETEILVGLSIADGAPQDESADAELYSHALAFGMVAVRLLVLGLVTYAHASRTRYPDGDLRPWRYNTRLGVVQALPVLYPMLTSCLRTQQQFLAMS